VAKEVTITMTVKDNFGKLDKSMRAMLKNEVLVGVPQDKSSRNDGSGVNNATLAYIHNTGSPSQNIPPRPFMEPGVEAVREKIEKRMKRIGELALKGNLQAVSVGFEGLGAIVRDSIKNIINQGNFTPLAASTLEARRRRGRKSKKPLVDTGEMRNSINYVVRKRK
jgi:hypothetical protein